MDVQFYVALKCYDQDFPVEIYFIRLPLQQNKQNLIRCQISPNPISLENNETEKFKLN